MVADPLYLSSGQLNTDEAQVHLPLSKSEGLRALVELYLDAKRSGAASMPIRFPVTDDVPEDLMVMLNALDLLLTGESDVTLSGSASVARFLLALCAAEHCPIRLHLMDKQLRRRPMGPLMEVLRSFGVSIEVRSDLWVVDGAHAAVPHGTIVDATDWSSSQFVSALVYYALSMEQSLRIRRSPSDGSSSYVRLTIDRLRRVGYRVKWEDGIIGVNGQAHTALLQPRLSIPGDWTAASYWFEWMALHPEVSSLHLEPLDVDSLHPDAVLLSLFHRILTYKRVPNGLQLSHRVRCLTPLFPSSVDLSQSPDLFPTLLATALGLSLPVTFTGLDSLAYKESDRLSASVEISCSMGWPERAFIRKGNHSVTYTGVPRETIPPEVILEHLDDHRLAMAFGMLATVLTETVVRIDGADGVTARSYPRFFAELCRLSPLPHSTER